MARLACAIALLACVSSGVAFAADRAETPEVDALISQGLELRRQNHPELALPIFQKAYEIERTPRTDGHLGLVLATLDRFVESEQHLVAALAVPHNGWVAKNRSMLEETLTKVRARLAEVAVDATPAGANIVVAGHAAGTAPLAGPVRVVAGDVDIQVNTDGYVAATRSIHVNGGEHVRLVVNLEKVAVSPAAAAPPASVTPPEPPQRSTQPSTTATSAGEVDEAAHPPADSGTSGLRIAAWVTAGTAVAALGVGVAYMINARDNRSDSDAFYSARRLSIAGYAAGGALAVTSAVLFLLSRPDSPSASAHAHLSCTPSLAGLACGGVF
jgi:hypothetical protein